MKSFIKKLTSRKFLTCIAGVLLGICMIFGLDEGTINTIAGTVTSVISVIIYIYTEGKVDAAAVKEAADKVSNTVNVVEKIEE